VQVLRNDFGATIIFFVIDSNEYTEGNIARGEIDKERLSWLVRQLDSIDKDLTPWESISAIKCLVLHHHVCDLKRRLFNPEGKFTKLMGAENLLKAIAGRIHVIFHGHEHYPTHFIEQQTGAVLISAGSTSQWYDKVRRNSFYH